MGEDDKVNWAYGVGYSVVASVIGGGSKLLIRKSYIMIQDIVVHEDDRDSEYLTCPLQIQMKSRNVALILRILGMFGMIFLNPLFCVIAMQYASPSILSTFSGLTLVWIILFSESFIGEKPNAKEILAASLLIAGEVIVAIFGDHTNENDVSVDEIISSYKSTAFVLYFASMMIFIFSLLHMILSKPLTDPLARFSFGALGGRYVSLYCF